MIAVLMGAQLWELNWSMEECDRWGRIIMEHAKQQAQTTGKPPAIAETSKLNECTVLEDEYRKTADQYLGIVLALLGGAGVAAGAGIRKDPRD